VYSRLLTVCVYVEFIVFLSSRSASRIVCIFRHLLSPQCAVSACMSSLVDETGQVAVAFDGILSV
jgi:hypothetical protein